VAAVAQGVVLQEECRRSWVVLIGHKKREIEEVQKNKRSDSYNEQQSVLLH